MTSPAVPADNGTLTSRRSPTTWADLTNRENRAFRPRFLNDFNNSSTGTIVNVPDGIPDDINGDGIPTITRPSTTTGWGSIRSIPLGNQLGWAPNWHSSSKTRIRFCPIPSRGPAHPAIEGNSYDVYAFPFIYPGMYSVPDPKRVNWRWAGSITSPPTPRYRPGISTTRRSTSARRMVSRRAATRPGGGSRPGARPWPAWLAPAAGWRDPITLRHQQQPLQPSRVAAVQSRRGGACVQLPEFPPAGHEITGQMPRLMASTGGTRARLRESPIPTPLLDDALAGRPDPDQRPELRRQGLRPRTPRSIQLESSAPISRSATGTWATPVFLPRPTPRTTPRTARSTGRTGKAIQRDRSPDRRALAGALQRAAGVRA